MNKAALIACLIVSIMIFSSNSCLAQQDLAIDIQALKSNSKIKLSDIALEDIMKGDLTTRVIVNLRTPLTEDQTIDQDSNSLDEGQDSRPPARNLADQSVRRWLENDVNALQSKVIDAMNLDTTHILHQFKYIYSFSAEITLQELKDLAEHPQVLSIDEDLILHANLAQGIPLMNASSITDTYNGAGMSIAICDTGIDYNHSMLGGGGFPNAKVIGGYDTGEDDTDPIDGNGHGTACAGIAAGSLGTTGDYIGGVARNAKLYALKISNTSTGGSAYSSDMIEAWEWCVTHQNDDPSNPIMIISTSFGVGKYTSQCDGVSTAMTNAAANARAVGMTLFVSSGNDGYCDAIGWPACINDVISVGAVYDAALGTIGWCVSADSCATKIATSGCSTGYYSPESGAADSVIVYSNSASILDLLAPANWAYSTDLNDGYWDAPYGFGGTSAACPYAAGAAASLQSAAKARTGAYLTPDQVKSSLVDNGDLITDGKVAITKPRVNLGNSINQITSAPLVTTTAASSITSSSASSGGNVTDDGAKTVTSRGVCWSTATNPTTAGSCTIDGSGTGSFTSTISGLIANTLYYVRAYAINSIGTSYGNNETFTTLSDPATVTTGSATSISQSTATLNGTVNPNGGATTYQFQYGPDQTYGSTTTVTSAGSGGLDVAVNASITGLNADTTYHYRLTATNSGGTSLGADITFKTLAAIVTGGDGGGGGCFIATAAFGSPLQPCVETLRKFRDRFLLNNSIGNYFINLYCRYSPPMADVISKHDNVRALVRFFLLPIVGMSWMALKFGLVSTLGFILLFLLMSAILFIFLRNAFLRLNTKSVTPNLSDHELSDQSAETM